MSKFSWVTSCLTCITLVCCLGCQDANVERTQASDTSPEFSDGLSAQQIFESMQLAYRNAESYEDHGQLYLSYQMAGQYVEERQPWNIKWQRDAASQTSRLSAQWYNAELHSDGVVTQCYVYDIETENLDQQCLVVEGNASDGIRRVLSDSIARHFCAGYSEIPLREGPEALIQNLTTPVFSWLSGTATWPVFDGNVELQRLDDANVDERACYHLRVGKLQMRCELWIDQETLVVRQMTLPIEFLHSAVTTSGEVNEVQFFARMHGATLNPKFDDTTFQALLPNKAIPVQQFVTIPESFPCEQIGNRLESLSLYRDNGDMFASADLLGRTSLFIWLEGLTGPQVLQHLEQLKKAQPLLTNIQLYVVYSNSLMDQKVEKNPHVNRSLEVSAESMGLKVTWLYDQQLFCANEIKLRSLPAAVVIDKTGILEYARPLAGLDWTDEAIAATSRTAQGERISEEMYDDYQAYVDRYKQKLQLVSAERLIQSSADAKAQNKKTAVQSLTSERWWRNTELTKPGNLYLLPNGKDVRLFAFDGWQTICELDLEGKLVAKTPIDLPPGEGVTCLRWSAKSHDVRAVFSPFARRVFLVDSDFRKVGDVKSQSGDTVVDCQFGSWQGSEVLWVAFARDGVRAYDLAGSEKTILSSERLDSIQITETHLYGIHQGRVVAFALQTGQTGAMSTMPIREQIVRLARNVVNRNSVPSAVGVDEDSIWYVLNWNGESNGWEKSVIGSQLFETSVEPLVQCVNETIDLTVAADTFGYVHLVSATDGNSGRLECDVGLAGLELSHGPDGILVLTSSPRGIAAWVINR